MKEIKKIKSNEILNKEVKKMIVYDQKNKTELAVITHKEITTSSSDILVRISFKKWLT